jgi:hypothetical protein
VEIDCPGSCVYLKTGRSYESQTKPLDPDVLARVRSFRPNFASEYGPVLEILGRAIAEERRGSPWIVDLDVMEVYRALGATMKTLSSGIHYESLPEGPARISMFRTLKSILDGMMSPTDAQQRALRVSEVLEVLDFLFLAVAANSSGRPRSRQYLDWLSTMFELAPPSPESGRLIIP